MFCGGIIKCFQTSTHFHLTRNACFHKYQVPAHSVQCGKTNLSRNATEMKTRKQLLLSTKPHQNH